MMEIRTTSDAELQLRRLQTRYELALATLERISEKVRVEKWTGYQCGDAASGALLVLSSLAPVDPLPANKIEVK